MISVTSLAVSDADSNTTVDTIQEENKLSSVLTNEESWSDVNLNEEADSRNINNVPLKGIQFFFICY